MNVRRFKGWLWHITKLDRSLSEVSDLTPLRGLTSLQWLRLDHTPVSDEQVAMLKKALPKLKVLR